MNALFVAMSPTDWIGGTTKESLVLAVYMDARPKEYEVKHEADRRSLCYSRRTIL